MIQYLYTLNLQLTGVLAVSVFFISCSGSGNEGRSDRERGYLDSMFAQAMVVHDEVMPRIDEIMQLKLEFKDLLKDRGTLTLSSTDSVELNRAIQVLEEADEMMMVWMRKYTKIPADSIEFEKAKAFVDSGYFKVKKVKNSILESIEHANQLKNKLNLSP